MIHPTRLVAALLLAATGTSAADFDARAAERFANLALACVHKEYPNKISHSMNSDADAKPPRLLTPAFYGCYDWHSAVHGHWMLARLARMFPTAPFSGKARAALEKSITPANIAAEAAYLNTTGRTSFERPYGLAWLLQLDEELREWNPKLAATLQPVTTAAVARLKDWLPKLPRPVRSGEHSQTAFALGLALDWARTAKDQQFIALLERRSRDFFANDRGCPLSWEPSGEDFVSPCLAEGDLMRRLLPPAEFEIWFAAFLPAFGDLGPVVSPDPSDPKLSHLDGLNLSRAWMLEGIASVLAEGGRRKRVEALAYAHREAGLKSVTGEHYEGGHWLGSFATYLTTRRGIRGIQVPLPPVVMAPPKAKPQP